MNSKFKRDSYLMISSILFAILLQGCSDAEPVKWTGLAETKEIMIASKLPGRLAEVTVQEGDTIHSGALVARMTSPEVEAKVAQAEGMLLSTEARLKLARKGARPEELRMAEAALSQAEDARKLAETSWLRIQKLWADSALPRQTADEAEFRFKSAQQNETAARQRVLMIQQGARPEELDALEGALLSARNAKLEASSWAKETSIFSPIDGVVQKVYLEAGEMAPAGAPLIAMIRPDRIWVVIALREDLLKGLPMGSRLQGSIPALGKDSVEFQLTWMSVMGDFATWRSTGRKGDTDLRTFEVRFEPVQPISGFLPGMTVQLTPPTQGK